MSETPGWTPEDFQKDTSEGIFKKVVAGYVNKDGTVRIDSRKAADAAMEAAGAEDYTGRSEVGEDILKTAIARTETTGWVSPLDSAMRASDEQEAIKLFLEAREEKRKLDAAYDEIQHDADKQKIEDLRNQLKNTK